MPSTTSIQQTTTVEREPVADEQVSVTGAPTGRVNVRIVRPEGADGVLPVILFIHDAGCVFDDAGTHDRLVRELAAGTGAAVVFPEYSLSHDAIEEGYAVARWIVREGFMYRLDASRVTIAGDCVGGNMAAALTILAKQRGDVNFKAQVLFYPVSDEHFDTARYHQFAKDYRPRHDTLTGLPKALVINAEADVLRDEGEAYARNLRAAGVDVTAIRFSGVIHDFVTVDALRETNAAGAAVRQAITFLKTAIEQ
jgi:acetyl esterase/lipase